VIPKAITSMQRENTTLLQRRAVNFAVELLMIH
jgi:hypothetical protein